MTQKEQKYVPKAPQISLAFDGKPDNSQTIFEEVIIFLFLLVTYFKITIQLLYLLVYILHSNLFGFINNLKFFTMHFELSSKQSQFGILKRWKVPL